MKDLLGVRARMWFYGQSEKRLYAVPRDTLPPDKGIGGPGRDGKRAVVVAFRGDQDAPRKRRIAYVETCTPELKDLLGKVQAARDDGLAVVARTRWAAADCLRAMISSIKTRSSGSP